MLRISEPHERHAGPILVADDKNNDVAEFFHNEEGTVDTTYERALELAGAMVAVANLQGQSSPRPQDFDHRCANDECPYIGQRTERSCGCHISREQMMLAEIARLRTAA